ncbi:unnamed protein product [Pleuronectes platessa]|uniref:Uncharacterized protein n=1 Tax=Pleuronectes platessa TaxID=8262 RepID=A0A9N7VEB1_PLEPL|nr:unnamed protein product [Pleuronectes platessa]
MPPKKGDSKSAAKKGKAEEPKKGAKDEKKGGKKAEEPPAKGKGKDDGKKGKGKKPVSESEEGSEEEEEEIQSEEEESDESEEEPKKPVKIDKGKGKAALKGASKAIAVKGFKPTSKPSPPSDDEESEEEVKPQMKKGMAAMNLKKMSDVHIKGASKAMMGFATDGQKKNAGPGRAQKAVDVTSHLKGASRALSGLTGKSSPFSLPSKQQPPEKAKPKRNLKSTSRLFLRISKKKKPPTEGKPLLGTSKLFAGFGAKSSSAAKKPGLSGFSLFNKKDAPEKETPPPKKTINLSNLGGKGKMAAEAKGLGGKFKGMLGKKKAESRLKTKSWMLGRMAAATNWLTGRFLTSKGQGRLGARAGGRGRKQLSFANRDNRGRQTEYYDEGFEYDDDEYGYEEEYQDRWRPRGFHRQPMAYDSYDPYEEEMDYYDDEEWEDEYGYYDEEGNFYHEDEYYYDDGMDPYGYPYGYYDDEYDDDYGEEGMEYYYGEDGMLYAVDPFSHYSNAMDSFYDPYAPELYGDYIDHDIYNYGRLEPYGMVSGGYNVVPGLYDNQMLGYIDPVAVQNPYQQHFYIDARLDPAESGQLYAQEQLPYPVAEPLAEQFRVPRPQVMLFGLALNNLERMSDIQYEQPFPTYLPTQPHYTTVMNQQPTHIPHRQAPSPTAMAFQQEHFPLPQFTHPPLSTSAKTEPPSIPTALNEARINQAYSRTPITLLVYIGKGSLTGPQWPVKGKLLSKRGDDHRAHLFLHHNREQGCQRGLSRRWQEEWRELDYAGLLPTKTQPPTTRKISLPPSCIPPHFSPSPPFPFFIPYHRAQPPHPVLYSQAEGGCKRSKSCAHGDCETLPS